MNKLTEGTLPDRPKGGHGEALIPDPLWEIMTQCWALDPSARPSALDILQVLQQIRTMSDLHLHDLTGDIFLGGSLQEVVTTGGFGDIRKGILRRTNKVVALKSLCIRGGGPQPNLKNTKVKKFLHYHIQIHLLTIRLRTAISPRSYDLESTKSSKYTSVLGDCRYRRIIHLSCFPVD